MAFGSLLYNSELWLELYIPKALPALRDHRTGNGLLLLKLTCWKNLTEFVIKSVDVVSCMKYIHFMVSAPFLPLPVPHTS